MYHMVLLVLDELSQCPTVLDAWEEAGVTGVTILESTGLGRARQIGMRDDLPLFTSLHKLMQNREERHRTLFTVVDSEEMVDRLIEITQEVMGGLNEPNKGVIFVLPVSRVVGLRAV